MIDEIKIWAENNNIFDFHIKGPIANFRLGAFSSQIDILNIMLNFSPFEIFLFCDDTLA